MWCRLQKHSLSQSPMAFICCRLEVQGVAATGGSMQPGGVAISRACRGGGGGGGGGAGRAERTFIDPGVIMMGWLAPLAERAKLMPLLLTRRPGAAAQAPAGAHAASGDASVWRDRRDARMHGRPGRLPLTPPRIQGGSLACQHTVAPKDCCSALGLVKVIRPQRSVHACMVQPVAPDRAARLRARCREHWKARR